MKKIKGYKKKNIINSIKKEIGNIEVKFKLIVLIGAKKKQNKQENILKIIK